jgi:hypothetical protein
VQLRKMTCHPYLAEPSPPYTTDEHLIEQAPRFRERERFACLNLQSDESYFRYLGGFRQ